MDFLAFQLGLTEYFAQEPPLRTSRTKEAGESPGIAKYPTLLMVPTEVELDIIVKHALEEAKEKHLQEQTRIHRKGTGASEMGSTKKSRRKLKKDASDAMRKS